MDPKAVIPGRAAERREGKHLCSLSSVDWWLGLPRAVLGNERIGENDEFSRDGDEGDLVRPSCGDESIVKGGHCRIASFCAEGAQIQNPAYRGASASDGTLTVSRSGLIGDRSQAREHGDLLSRASSKLGHAGDERGGGYWSHATDRKQDRVTARAGVLPTPRTLSLSLYGGRWA